MTKQLSIRYKDQDFLFNTEESLFSPNQLDSGSRLLLDSLLIPDHAKSVLDVGCGWGAMGTILAKLNPEINFTLIDVDPNAVEYANQNILQNGIKNAKVFVKDATKMDSQEKFDLVISNLPWTKNISVNPPLVKFAFDSLNQNGIFVGVINQTFRLQDEMQKIFGNVEEIGKHSSYKVLKSTKSDSKRNDLLDETVSKIKTNFINPDPLKSQFFLTDSKIIKGLIDAADLNNNDIVLEIGAGLGSLTSDLSKRAKVVEAIEIDNQFSTILKTLPTNVHLNIEDFFKVFKNRTSAPKFNKIISVLPFNTSGPIIYKLINYPFEIAILVLSKKFTGKLINVEFSEEINVEKLFDIPRAFFYPIGQTDSVAVKITKKLRTS